MASSISINEKIDGILQSIQGIEKPNYAQIAREKEVPYHRLLARSKGRKTYNQRKSSTKKLSDTQEYALLAYIKRLDRLGICTKIPMIVDCANYLLQVAGQKPTATRRWAKYWFKHQPKLYHRRQRALELNRASAHDKPLLTRWFKDYTEIIDDNGINGSDIWNFDETGFRIGIGKDQWVITFEPKKRLHLASPDDRTSVTVVEAVNAIGDVIPPMIVISGALFLERYFDDLPDGYLVTHSETGFANDEISYNWVKHFIKYSSNYQKGVSKLLLFDGFDSHCTQEFLENLEDNHITPYRLPPHTSHFLQPLDVGPFQPYKHWHAEAVDAATRTGCTSFNKVEFLAAIESIRYFTFKRRSIVKGWKETGLFPPNLAVLHSNIERESPTIVTQSPSQPARQPASQPARQSASQLADQPVIELDSELDSDLESEIDIELQKQVLEFNQTAERLACRLDDQLDKQLDNKLDDQLDDELDNQLESSPIRTPTCIRTLKYYHTKLLKRVDHPDLKRVQKGAENLAVAGDQAVAELTTMTSIAQTRRKRQLRTNKVLRTEMGVIYSHQARKMVNNRIWEEVAIIIRKNHEMKRAPVTAQKRHAEAYAPIHKQLERVWASMRAANYLLLQD